MHNAQTKLKPEQNKDKNNHCIQKFYKKVKKKCIYARIYNKIKHL
jgi:hypothetical protein